MPTSAAMRRLLMGAVASLLVVVGAALAHGPPPSSGGPATTPPPMTPAISALAAIDDARRAVLAGAWGEAVHALDIARADVGARSPLAVAVAIPTLGPHRGLGVYDLLPGGVVPGRNLHVYLEVEGITASPEADGRFAHEVSVRGRFFVAGPDGALEALGEKDLGTQRIVSWRRLPTQAVGVDIVLGDAPAGAYVVELVVTDNRTSQQATARAPFRLR